MRELMRRLLREPLLHFLLAALLIIAVYAAAGPREEEGDMRIVVSGNRIEQLASVFAKTWQRPPTEAELKGLIDDFVKEEIYVREARKLGLDVDDTVVRRRLRLKMEFLSEAEASLTPPSEGELQAFLKDHPEKFAKPPRYSFDQVNFSPAKRSDAEADARKVLVALNGAAPPEPATLGDPTLLPSSLEDVEADEIARGFGDEFAASLASLPVGAWTGPLNSAYGVHLVRLRARTAGRAPPLDEVRDAVLRELQHARRTQLEEQRLNALLERYTVIIAQPGAAAP